MATPEQEARFRQYWNWDPNTNAWTPNPDTNPDGRHWSQVAQNHAPPEGGDGDGSPPPTENDWASLGLAGGNGTDWWIASMLEGMRAGRIPFDGDPALLTDDFFRDVITEWNATSQEERTHILDFDPNGGLDAFTQGQQSWDNSPNNPNRVTPPGGGGRGGGIQAPPPGAQGDDAFLAAYMAWNQGGRVGPRPSEADFGVSTDPIPGGNADPPPADDGGLTDPALPPVMPPAAGDGGYMTGKPGGGMLGPPVTDPPGGTKPPQLGPPLTQPPGGTKPPQLGPPLTDHGGTGRTDGPRDQAGGGPRQLGAPPSQGGGPRQLGSPPQQAGEGSYSGLSGATQSGTGGGTRPGQNATPGFSNPMKRKKKANYGGGMGGALG